MVLVFLAFTKWGQERRSLAASGGLVQGVAEISWGRHVGFPCHERMDSLVFPSAWRSHTPWTFGDSRSLTHPTKSGSFFFFLFFSRRSMNHAC